MKRVFSLFLILAVVMISTTSCSSNEEREGSTNTGETIYPYIDISYNSTASSGQGNMYLSRTEYPTFEEVFSQAEIVATVRVVQYEKTYTIIPSPDAEAYSLFGNTLFSAKFEQLHKGNGPVSGDPFYLYQLGTWKGGTVAGYPLFQDGIRLLMALESYQMDMYRSELVAESGYRGIAENSTVLQVVTYEGVDYVIDRAHPYFFSECSLTPVAPELQQNILTLIGSGYGENNVYLYEDLLYYMEGLQK